MRLPFFTMRRFYTDLFKTNVMRVVSRFDVDLYIIVDDRQRQIMRRSINIDDVLYPPMYSRKISSSTFIGGRKRPNERFDGVKESALPDGAMASRSACFSESVEPTLVDSIRDMDDTFAVRLLKLIDIKGMDEVKCYKAANVSRQTWYKIMNEGDYRPSKNTVISFAISLSLDYEETQALLATAGYTLSGSILFDKIIAYCIREGIYDVFSINAMLYSYDQECLGS